MSKFRFAGLRWTGGITFVAVLCAIAALFGSCHALANYRYVPPAPAGCSLVRPEVIDIIVPGHDPALPLGMTLLFNSSYERPDLTSSYCEIQSASTFLGIAVWRLGSGPAGDPASQADDTFVRLRASMASAGTIIPDGLGDESIVGTVAGDHMEFGYIGFYNDGHRFPIITAYGGRLGTFVVQVAFGSREPITAERARIATRSVFEEVLSQL